MITFSSNIFCPNNVLSTSIANYSKTKRIKQVLSYNFSRRGEDVRRIVLKLSKSDLYTLKAIRLNWCGD